MLLVAIILMVTYVPAILYVICQSGLGVTMSDRVSVSREDHLAIVSLSNPDRLNVLDRGGWETLAFIMKSLAEDQHVRCVVIEGAGNRAFSAGSDIREFSDERQTPEQVLAYGRALEGALSALRGCPHPTVALIHGVCVGGGLEIAASCDLRICSESSRFGAPINRLGLTMSYTELRPLVELTYLSPSHMSSSSKSSSLS